MTFKNYYKILGLKDYASVTEIKKAYRALALRYHPDRNKGGKSGTDLFIGIKEAYETLIDPLKRKKFDAELRSRNFYAPSYGFSRYVTRDGDVTAEKAPPDVSERTGYGRMFLKPVILVLITIGLMYVLMRLPLWLSFFGLK